MDAYINSLVKRIESIPSDTLSANIRLVAGENLGECKPLGIPGLSSIEDRMFGTNEVLSESVLLDAIVLTCGVKSDDISLVLSRSSHIAKMNGFSKINIVDLPVQREKICEAFNIESHIERVEDSNSKNNSGDCNTGDLETTNDDEAESQIKSKLAESIFNYYSQYCTGVISELLKRYSSLFSSGYEINKPAGLLTRDGIVRLSGSSRVVYEDTVATANMYDVFGKLGFEEVSTRSVKGISNIIYRRFMEGGNTVLYFPNKLLEIAYGRCAPDGDNQESLNTYKEHSDSSNWSNYLKNELSKSIRYLVRQSVVGYVMNTMGDGDDYRNPSIVHGLGSFLKYMQDCLSSCLLMIEYKSATLNGEKEITAFKVRVCDPQNMLGNRNITSDILNKAFLGGVGKNPFTYDVRIEEDTFVKEYAHEFNHDVSQAMPLFAYKALLSLKAQNIELSWENMILGMFEDGTILRNGSHGVDLLNRLLHFIIAGSRAGKGVMTLAILASAIASGKIILYLDRKPDMASLFKYLAPYMCVINGGGYSEQYDIKYKQFTDLNSYINSERTPSMVLEAFQTTATWDELGDIVYMRLLKLVIGIIVARGEGKFNDENFGGRNGILLVADEFKNFQDSFSNLVSRAVSLVPPTTIDKDREALEKGTISQKTFDRSYNDASFYALSFLNSLADDMKFLSEKTDAGFNQEEIALSDIVVIGQSLEKGMADRMEFADALRNSPGSARYRSAGSTGLKSFSLGNQSIPYSLVNFKPSDAFFGRNMDDGRSVYLAQTNKGSKAYGRLDDKASNFAYMGTFTEDKRKKVVGGKVTENVELANSCTYFKPFLILNTGDPEDDCVVGCLNRCSINGGITKEEMVAEYPNSNGTNLNPAIGFEEYMRLAGISNYKEILEQSSKVANYVVQNCLHYPGNWFEFITDFRPEWLFSIRDISEGAKGSVPRVNTPSDNPVVEEFYEFNPGVFGGSSADDDLSEDSTGELDSYFSDQDIFSDEGSVAEEDINDDELSLGSFGGEDGYTDSFSVNTLEGDFDSISGFSDISTNYESTNFPDENTTNNSVETGEYLKENSSNLIDFEGSVSSSLSNDNYTDLFGFMDSNEGDSGRVGDESNRIQDDTLRDYFNRGRLDDDNHTTRENQAYANKGNSDTAESRMDKILGHMRALKELGIDLEVGPDGWVQRFSPPPSETFESYGEATDFSDHVNNIDYSNEVNSLGALMGLITEDLINKFGGYARIKSFRVVGGMLIINGYYYKCNVKDLHATGIPLDVKSDLESGNLCRLFNYATLKSMYNIHHLEFDSISFTYDYVSTAMGYGNSISVNRFFDDFALLNTLKLGEEKFTRADYLEKSMGNDLFYSPRMATRLADASERAFRNVRKSSWSFTKGIASKSNYNMVLKALGITGGVAVTGAALGGQVTTKLGRKAYRGIKSLSRGVRELFNGE